MHLTEDIKPISYLKSKAADVLKQINQSHRPMVITQNGEVRAVVQDPQSYEDMKNAISLLKLLSFAEEDIKNGNLHNEEDVFHAVEELLDRE